MCVKVPYLSRADARRAAAKARGGLREYLCPHCDLWHLTSKTKREVKLNRRRG